MAYLFRCTTKQSIGGGKVPKGVTIQVVTQYDRPPQTNELRNAIKQQLGIELGIEVKESFSASYFNIEKVRK